MTFWVLFAIFVAPALISAAISAARLAFAERPHWRDADHGTTGQAPSPAETRTAVAQVYGARTWGLRGAVAMHTWIAVKRTDADHYMRYEVIGWRLRRTGSALVQERGRADAMWFSNRPLLLADLRGAGVDAVIDRIEAAVADYPYVREYRMWPGPNSNTFTAFVARRVPELRLDLPPTAIGKDYLARSALLGTAPSGTGYQFSLFGAIGAMAARQEGVEVNLLGLVAGIRWRPLAIKLPGLGTWPARRPIPAGA